MSEHNIDKDNIDIDVSSALDTDTTSDANTDTDANISADANNETESSSTDALNASSDAVKDNEDESYLPLLALRDVVVYPHMQIALFVGRAPSVKAVELAQAEYGNKVLVVAQKDSLTEDIDQDNLYQYGTVCRIVSTMPHDSDENCIKVLIEGQYRARVDNIEGCLLYTSPSPRD